jgi:hypothetical protein
MSIYTITFNNKSEKFVMNGYEEIFIGEHFLNIAVLEGMQAEVRTAISEGHALSILRNNGIEIDLIEEDGSLMSW